MVTIADTRTLEEQKDRINPVLMRWDKMIDYLMTQEWNVTKAYQYAYPRTKETSADVASYTLLDNVRFKERFKYLQSTKYGYNEDHLRNFWKDKLLNAKKEENSMRASENIAKNLQMTGFGQDNQIKQAIQVNVVFDEKVSTG